MNQDLKNTCYLGFDCKSMTGELGDNCPNLHLCADSAIQHTRDERALIESLPYYIDYRNNALTVYRFLSPAARDAGWQVASSLPYRYEDDCLIVDAIDYYYNSESTILELGQKGWQPPKLVPWQIVDGYLEVIQDLPEAAWGKPELLPYLKTSSELYVQDIYNYDCSSAGWQSAIDIIDIYQKVICDNYCPICGYNKVLSVVFDDFEDNYRSYHHCPNCLWSANIIPDWIESNYFKL